MSERGKRIIQSDYFLPVAKLRLLLLYYINKTIRQTSVTGGAIIATVIVSIIAAVIIAIITFIIVTIIHFVIKITCFRHTDSFSSSRLLRLSRACSPYRVFLSGVLLPRHSLSSAHAECVPCLFLIIHIFC